jgi:hypothetical protein
VHKVLCTVDLGWLKNRLQQVVGSHDAHLLRESTAASCWITWCTSAAYRFVQSTKDLGFWWICQQLLLQRDGTPKPPFFFWCKSTQ